MSRLGIVRGAALVLSAALVAACQSNSPAPIEGGGSNVPAASGAEAPILPEPGLQLAPDQRFSDVPLPVGLDEDMERTYVYESSTLQIGRMVYTTRHSINELADFFMREAPAADWSLQSLTQADGARLEFAKPGRRLVVSINNLGVPRGREVIIDLTPDDGGPVRSEK